MTEGLTDQFVLDFSLASLASMVAKMVAARFNWMTLATCLKMKPGREIKAIQLPKVT